MKIVALIQARMGSTRLPGKVMKNLSGMPMIELLLMRLSRSSLINQIVVATSENKDNDILADFVRGIGFSVYRGSENDVLKRFYEAAGNFKGDVLVRITADCPLIDPYLVDQVITKYLDESVDYATNTLPPSYPDGLDVEVFSFTALEKAFKEATEFSEREHVTPYIRNSGLFQIANLKNDRDYSMQRWTVDEISDFKVVEKIIESFSPNFYFGWEEIIKLNEERPDIFAMNEHIMRNEGYILGKLNEIELRDIANFEKSDEYRASIHALIPGGSHTYSKGDDQFPLNSPAAISYGKGAYVWDIDGNQYLDCSMGLTSVSLGHAYQPIIQAVSRELERGVNFQRPSMLEREMAECFLSLVPCHEMVKFAKNGSIVTTAAVKLARAKTGRKLVAFPADHPFYSYDDWFIGTTPCNKGVPDEISSLSVTFNSFDLQSLTALFKKFPDQIACVITEPEKSLYRSELGKDFSPKEFLQKAIELCHANGALFIADEMVTGFKTAFPGSISKFDLKPDMATWGKGIANGFSFCALTGKKEVMDLGGINRPGEEKVFLISTTHGGETHALSAAIATIKEFKEKGVINHIHTLSTLLSKLCQKFVKDMEVEKYIEVIDCEWMPTFVFKNSNGDVCPGFRTLFMQEMIKKGVLFQGIFLTSFSHTEDDIFYFVKAFKHSITVYKNALQSDYKHYLVGEPAKAVFRKVL